jgi:L-iditol 2-dehydrogenase
MSPERRELNLGAVLHGIGDLRVEEIPMPVPANNEVLISIRSVGICGSDAHYLDHGRIGNFVCTGPMVLGHEASGVVTALGADVKSLAVGDRVAIEPGVACASCDMCRKGRYNLCPDVRFAATPPVHGSLARFVAHPAAFCYRLPDSMPFEHAALLEPLSVGIHACRRAHIALGHTVLITGSGTVGLLSMVAARAAGAHRIVITDVDEGRLAVAKTLGAGGADETILVNADTDLNALGAKIAADACIECSGAEAGVRLCIYGAKRGGTVVLVGIGKPEMSIPILDAACREVDIRGIFRYCDTYPTAMTLATRVDFSELITHKFTLEDAPRAFETFKSRECKAIKVVIDCATIS